MKTLLDIKPSVGKFPLKHPVTLEPLTTDEGVEVIWDVVGQDSDEYLLAQQDFLKDLEKMGDKASKMTAVDYKEQTAIQLAKVVVGWDEQFNDFMGGPFSTDKVNKLLTGIDQKWIVSQLDLFVSQRRNFFTV